jgi:hypothetical protein
MTTCWNNKSAYEWLLVAGAASLLLLAPSKQNDNVVRAFVPQPQRWRPFLAYSTSSLLAAPKRLEENVEGVVYVNDKVCLPFQDFFIIASTFLIRKILTLFFFFMNTVYQLRCLF